MSKEKFKTKNKKVLFDDNGKIKKTDNLNEI